MILSLLIFVISCSVKNNEATITDTVEKEKEIEIVQDLSSEAIEILFYPDATFIYQMAPFFKTSEEKLDKYYVDKMVKIDDKKFREVRDIIFHEGYYRKNPVKKCLFHPQKAIRFIKNGQDLLLFVSLECKQLKFVYGNQQLVFDFDKGMPFLAESLESILKKRIAEIEAAKEKQIAEVEENTKEKQA